MSILHVLQEDLLKEGIDLKIDEYPVNITSTDIMRLNNEIELTVKDNRVMLESSPGRAARYACSK